MATDKVVIAGSPIAASQMSEFYQQVGRGGLTAPHMDALLERRDPFLPNIDWRSAYSHMNSIGSICFTPAELLKLGRFGGYADIADEWCIPVLKGLTVTGLLETLGGLGVSIKAGAQPKEEKLVHVRDASVSGSYGIRFKRRVNADMGLADASSSELIDANPMGMTLVEGLLLEIGYWVTAQSHLNVHDHTLCTGTKDITPVESDRDNPYGVWSLTWYIPSLIVSYDHESGSSGLRHRSRKSCGKWPLAA
jgi:hypothetical protein